MKKLNMFHKSIALSLAVITDAVCQVYDKDRTIAWRMIIMRMRKYWKNIAVGFLAIAIVFTMLPVDNLQVVSATTDVKINSLTTDIGNCVYNQEGTGYSGCVNLLNGGNDAARTDTKLFSPKAVVNQTGYGSVDLSWDNYYDVNGNAIQYDKNFVINVSEDNKEWDG